MIKINSALLLFFFAFALYLLSVIFNNDNLELFSKPIILPSIYYYYYTKVKGKINYLFTLSILFFFIGEILKLLNENDFLISSLIFFGLPYVIVTFFLAQDFLYYSRVKNYEINSISFYILLFLLFYLLYNILSFINESSQLEFSIYIIYGILLLVMSLMSFVIQFNFDNKATSNMVLMMVFFIVSDFFFIFAKSTKDVLVLQIVYIISQQLSYYMYVNYFICRTKLFPHLKS